MCKMVEIFTKITSIFINSWENHYLKAGSWPEFVLPPPPVPISAPWPSPCSPGDPPMPPVANGSSVKMSFRSPKPKSSSPLPVGLRSSMSRPKPKSSSARDSWCSLKAAWEDWKINQLIQTMSRSFCPTRNTYYIARVHYKCQVVEKKTT